MQLTTSRQRLAAVALAGTVVTALAVTLDSCLGKRDSSDDDTEEAEVNPYLDQVPEFPAAPEPEPVTLPAATDGEVPVVHNLETDQPVAFITVDDGHVRHPDAPLLLEAAGVPVSLFLLSSVIEEAAVEDPEYFDQLVQLGSTVQAHSITHPSLEDADRDFQEEEICGSADEVEEHFGRPTLFRPPYGAYDDTTLEVAAECGMTAVVHWRATVDYGEIMLQPGEDSLQPGDILLLHFREDFVEDFLVALEEIDQAGLVPARLEDYLS